MTEIHAQEDRRDAPRTQVRLFDMPIDVVTERQTVDVVLSAIARGEGGWIVTANLDQLRQYRRNSSLRDLFDGVSLIVPDGMPLVWAARMQRTPLPERVAGSALIWSLTEAAADAQVSVYLLGGSSGVADRAADAMRRRYPRLRIAGTICPQPGFENDVRALLEISSSLEAAGAGIVYVALGFPKQERLIERLREDFPNTWFMGVGISFSFVSGDVKRAPVWIQRLGLEWVHRLIQEPRRLFSRYLLRDLPFAIRLAGHVLLQREKP
jgi:N-acetylglucosaminyldiphosphoundecaprenol N-acetyl-beta-D-mannosaminyltransferase